LLIYVEQLQFFFHIFLASLGIPWEGLRWNIGVQFSLPEKIIIWT